MLQSITFLIFGAIRSDSLFSLYQHFLGMLGESELKGRTKASFVNSDLPQVILAGLECQSTRVKRNPELSNLPELRHNVSCLNPRRSCLRLQRGPVARQPHIVGDL